MPRHTLALPLFVIGLGIAFTIALVAHTDTDGIPIAVSQSGYSAPTTTTGAYPAATTAATSAAPATTVEPTTAPESGTPTPLLFEDPETSPTIASQPTIPAAPTLVAPTPTFVLSNSLACMPGETIQIEGTGPPRAPFLISFGQRIVGGGSVDAAGNFSVPLVVGMERAGIYPVTVRVRGQSLILREINCTVPAITPTPLKARRGQP